MSVISETRDLLFHIMVKTNNRAVPREARESGHITGREMATTEALVISMEVEMISIKVVTIMLDMKEVKRIKEKMMIEKTLLGRLAG